MAAMAREREREREKERERVKGRDEGLEGSITTVHM